MRNLDLINAATRLRNNIETWIERKHGNPNLEAGYMAACNVGYMYMGVLDRKVDRLRGETKRNESLQENAIVEDIQDFLAVSEKALDLMVQWH